MKTSTIEICSILMNSSTSTEFDATIARHFKTNVFSVRKLLRDRLNTLLSDSKANADTDVGQMLITVLEVLGGKIKRADIMSKDVIYAFMFAASLVYVTLLSRGAL